jgi:hypothetical protein
VNVLHLDLAKRFLFDPERNSAAAPVAALLVRDLLLVAQSYELQLVVAGQHSIRIDDVELDFHVIFGGEDDLARRVGGVQDRQGYAWSHCPRGAGDHQSADQANGRAEGSPAGKGEKRRQVSS